MKCIRCGRSIRFSKVDVVGEICECQLPTAAVEPKRPAWIDKAVKEIQEVYDEVGGPIRDDFMAKIIETHWRQ